ELILLNILEGYDLKAMGHNSAEYNHASAGALKLAFADREKFLGDIDFINIPFEGLLSKEYAADRRKLIDPNHASLEMRPGNPQKFVKGSQAALFQDPVVNLDKQKRTRLCKLLQEFLAGEATQLVPELREEFVAVSRNLKPINLEECWSRLMSESKFAD